MGLSLKHISPPDFVPAWVDAHATITTNAAERYLTHLIDEYRTAEPTGAPRRQLNPHPVCAPRVIVSRGGLLFQVKTEGTQPEWFRGKKRGKVKHFSRAARARAMQLCMSVDIDASGGLPILVTLTYPGEYPTDGPTTKGHLDAFLKRLYRLDKSIAAVWKVEPQERGAPHYHLLCYGTNYIDKAWVARAWFDVVNSGDAAHLSAGTRVEKVRDYNGVVVYASKYICKRIEGGENWTVGRWWGVHNRKALHVDLQEYSLSDDQYYRLRRIMRAYASSKGFEIRKTKAAKGFTTFLQESKSRSILDHLAT